MLSCRISSRGVHFSPCSALEMALRIMVQDTNISGVAIGPDVVANHSKFAAVRARSSLSRG